MLIYSFNDGTVLIYQNDLIEELNRNIWQTTRNIAQWHKSNENGNAKLSTTTKLSYGFALILYTCNV